ncbi:MAG: F0F1 ATP synthase subunit B [Acidobacteria bacterium]|jgi:F-type H+-transporting ATPase subunit b|nr:MAG: F0F1 ATP synthase subunit B [Acidobacteriota bacterium]
MDIQQAMYPNATLLIQAVLFLVFVALLRWVLIKPYTQVIEERENLINKNFEESLVLKEEAQKLLTQAKEILEKGRIESNQILEQARREAEKYKAELLSKVELEAQQEVSKAVEEIRNSLQEEKRKLDERIREIGELIASKVIEEAA